MERFNRLEKEAKQLQETALLEQGYADDMRTRLEEGADKHDNLLDERFEIFDRNEDIFVYEVRWTGEGGTVRLYRNAIDAKTVADEGNSHRSWKQKVGQWMLGRPYHYIVTTRRVKAHAK